MTTEIFCFYLQNRLIQASNTGGQWYSDTSPFSIPWTNTRLVQKFSNYGRKKFYNMGPSGQYYKLFAAVIMPLAAYFSMISTELC